VQSAVVDKELEERQYHRPKPNVNGERPEPGLDEFHGPEPARNSAVDTNAGDLVAPRLERISARIKGAQSVVSRFVYMAIDGWLCSSIMGR
jgi:hypothetical protein